MTPDLATFAKVRALHDRTTNLGEKAAAASRMKVLARKAGMTVAQAVSKLDAKPQHAPKPQGPSFADIFDSPSFRKANAERQQRYAERRAAALAEYGSEDAVWARNERETALERACRPFIVRKPIINGEMDTLRGWDGGSFDRLDPEVRAAVANAYAPLATVREAWAEFRFWEKLADDRTAFCDLYDHGVRVRARTGYIEHTLDTLPARSMNDLRARFDWMQHMSDRNWNRGNPEDATLLATLRADIERMGARLRDQDAGFHGEVVKPASDQGPAQSGHATNPIKSGQCDRGGQSKSGSSSVVQDGQADTPAGSGNPDCTSFRGSVHAGEGDRTSPGGNVPDRNNAAQDRGEIAARGGERSGRERSPAAPLSAPDLATSSTVQPGQAQKYPPGGHFPRRTNADKRCDVLAGPSTTARK